jgi:hypothetical protein
MMRLLRHMVALGLALGLAQLARAEEPAAPSGQTLGMIEGILKKCAEIDPAHAAQYRDQVKIATQDASEKSLSEVRSSEDYKKAYESIAGSLDAVSEADALKACKGSLAPGQ